MAPIEPITRRKLADEVFDRLLRDIEAGAHPPGSQMPSERELMAVYQVGRPAVREAMQRLEKLGLILITHGERARVARPTADDVMRQIDHAARHALATQPASFEELQEARIFFETGIMREAVRLVTSADIARLEQALALQTAAYDQKLTENSGRFVAADMAFHTAIAAIPRNGILEAVSRALLQWLSTFHAGLLHWKGHEHITLEEHRLILDAIAARDEAAAVSAMRAHLRRSRSLFQSPG